MKKENNQYLNELIVALESFNSSPSLNNQIETYKLYITSIEKKMKDLEDLVEELKSRRKDDDTEDDLQKKISILKTEIYELERKKIKLEYDIKSFTQDKEKLMMDTTETDFKETLNIVKKDVEDANIKILHQLQKNKIETDLETKLNKSTIRTRINRIIRKFNYRYN